MNPDPRRPRCPFCGLKHFAGDPVQKFRTADGVAYYAHPRCRRIREALGDQREKLSWEGGQLPAASDQPESEASPAGGWKLGAGGSDA